MKLQDVISLRLADVIFPAEHPLAGQVGVVNGFVVPHEQGLVLIDTGLGWGNAEIDEYYRPVRWRLPDRLSERGLRMEDSIVLINTHLHFDHCGQNSLFPSVPIYVQAAEYAAAHTPDFTIVEWVDFPGASYQQLDGEREVLPGVKIIPTPGHTPGHQSVVLDTDEGIVIIAGQAVYSAAEFAQLSQSGEVPSQPSPVGLASARRLLALRPRRVLFSHDDAVWDNP